MTMRLTPALVKWRAVRAFISPAPTISAVWALKSEYTRRARLTVAEASETALAPIRVSERTRLAAEKAAWNSLLSDGPGAAGFLRDAVGILQLAQDLRLAQHHGIEPGRDAEGMLDGALFLMHIQTGGEVEIVAVMPLEPLRQLRAARRSRPSTPRCDCRWTGSPLRRPRASCRNVRSAATSRSSPNATFSRSATGAVL